MIRKLDKAEFQQATTLALEVYLQCGQDDFEDEGLESFKSFISVSYTHLRAHET